VGPSSNLSYTGGKGRRTVVRCQSGQKQETLTEKQAESEKTGGAAQMVECLPRTPEFNP
jgi:hypothetical protein